jgi:hypothetical protein
MFLAITIYSSTACSSIEKSGEGDYIRPWVWVAALFFGPLFVSICFQWYIYIGTWVLARTQGILTELVFEHSLRIRFKAESSGAGAGGAPTASGAATPADGASEAGDIDDDDSNTVEGGSEAGSVRTDTTVVKGKGKATVAAAAAAAPVQSATQDEDKKKDNLVGKINTLVTVDVDNITNGKDFLLLCEL